MTPRAQTRFEVAFAPKYAFERGIRVSYETVRRWVNHFGPMVAVDLRKRRPKPHTTWHLDEVYLKIILSFAQFEREVTGERIRDKIAASKEKGMWMGGMPPLGFDVKTASSSSTTPRPASLSRSTGAISRSSRFTRCGTSLSTPGSRTSAACDRY